MEKEKWTYNGVDLTSKGKWGVEEILEGLGMPKYRGSDLRVPFQHGNRWIKKKFDRRKVVLSMWIRGTSRAGLDDNIDAFLKAIGNPGLHTLKRAMRNGSVREAQAEICSEINFVTKNPGYAKFALEFELADPFFYGTSKTTETKTISTKTYSWTHFNNGSAPVTEAVITLTGPLSNPVVTNSDNDIWLQYLGVIESGEAVVLNTRYFTCLKDKKNMITTVRHGGDAYWMVLESGNNSMKLTTDTEGGTVKIEYYPAYF